MKSPTEKCCEAIRWAMQAKDLKQYQIEDKCAIPRGSIGKWLTNERKSLSAENVGRVLLAFPEIDADWMMRDERQHQMLRKTAPVDDGKGVPSPDEASRDTDVKKLFDLLERQQKRLDAALAYISALQRIESGDTLPPITDFD